MSSDEAEALMEDIEKRWNSKHRDAFLHRMEKKLRRREEGFIAGRSS